MECFFAKIVCKHLFLYSDDYVNKFLVMLLEFESISFHLCSVGCVNFLFDG